MKRFWLVLLSLGLIMAFSASAFAVDVKVSGEYYAAGMYLNRTNVNDVTIPAVSASAPGVVPAVTAKPAVPADVSTAFFFQRLRVGTEFVVSPSLKLVTRFDALERIWGGARSASGTTLAKDSYETAAENENIAIDWVYIDYVSPIGIFDVGIMNDGATGTIFGNSYAPAGRIKYSYTNGPATLNLAYTKVKDQSYSAVTTTIIATDVDNDKYGIEGVYKFKDGKAGINVNYYRYAEKRPPPDNYKKTYFLFTPYAIAKIGPVDIQAELNYATGDVKKYDNGVGDLKMENISAWIDATANLGMVYVGGTIAYVSGDDPGTTDKQEGGTIDGGRDWNPCLIMFNADVTALSWAGTISGYNSSTINGPMKNAWFGQGRVGVKPISQLDAMLSVSYAQADKKPAGFPNGTYGWEVDVTGTYKITNNLSYMLGVGYLFTGDYYKGFDGDNKVENDYMLINKLTLTF